jgi:hypothetical protein
MSCSPPSPSPARLLDRQAHVSPAPRLGLRMRLRAGPCTRPPARTRPCAARTGPRPQPCVGLPHQLLCCRPRPSAGPCRPCASANRANSNPECVFLGVGPSQASSRNMGMGRRVGAWARGRAGRHAGRRGRHVIGCAAARRAARVNMQAEVGAWGAWEHRSMATSAQGRRAAAVRRHGRTPRPRAGAPARAVPPACRGACARWAHERRRALAAPAALTQAAARGAARSPGGPSRAGRPAAGSPRGGVRGGIPRGWAGRPHGGAGRAWVLDIRPVRSPPEPLPGRVAPRVAPGRRPRRPRRSARRAPRSAGVRVRARA